MKKITWQKFASFSFSVYLNIAAILTLSVVLTGCGLPKSMGVRSGVEPRHQDDDVRFRVTYFYRVYDYCANPLKNQPDANNLQNIQSDSLYRFRMTGKANSLFTKVAFESGTLKSYEIDPLGANIVFDKKNSSFHFQSREQTEQAAACAANEIEMDRLTRRIAGLTAATTPANRSAYDELISGLQRRIVELAASAACVPGQVARENIATHSGSQAFLNIVGRQLQSAAAQLTSAEYKSHPSTDVKIDMSSLQGPLNSAGSVLALLQSGENSTTAFSAVGKYFFEHDISPAASTLTDKTGVAVDRAATQKRQDEMQKLIRRISSKIKESGFALTEVSRQPQTGLLFLAMSGNRLSEAASALRELKRFVVDSQKTLGVQDDRYKPGRVFDFIENVASSLDDAGHYLNLAGGQRIVASNGCGPTENLKRGFQLIGPQASTTFDPDDRLIMAMSTSASPLLKQLKDISNRVLAEQQTPGDSLLQLTRARLRVSHATTRLKDVSTDDKKPEDLESLREKALQGVQP